MFGDFFLLDAGDGAPAQRAARLQLGETSGRNEAWLRDTLLAHPDVIPVGDIDASFGPLIPLCSELKVGSGRLDAAFINRVGQLTLVECKLWRNPEARRKVVAQILDYARVVSRWTYSDLEREVKARRGDGLTPFQIASRGGADHQEAWFVDQVSRNLRRGRFLLIIAGDGIQEDVDGLTQLINRNAASGFAFGLIEAALYQLPSGGLVVHPRVVAKTQIIERTVVIVRDDLSQALNLIDADEAEAQGEESPVQRNSTSDLHARYRQWWQDVLEMTFDDPDQEPPKLFWPNHVRVPLPGQNTWLTAYSVKNHRKAGVQLVSRHRDELLASLEPQREQILKDLPTGSGLMRPTAGNGWTYQCEASFDPTDDPQASRQWLKATINQFANVFRPLLKQLDEEGSLPG